MLLDDIYSITGPLGVDNLQNPWGLNNLALIFMVLMIVFAVVAIGLTVIIFIFPKIRENITDKGVKRIIEKANNDADKIRKNAEFDGQQKVRELEAKANQEIKEKKQEVVALEQKLLQRENSINQRDAQLLKKESTIEQKETLLDQQIEENRKRKEQLQGKLDSIIDELQKVSQMSLKEAKDEIFKRVEEKCDREIALYIKNREEEAEATCEEKAQNLLANAMFRQAQEVTTDHTISVIQLPNDEMKGRIIGREGRNIKSLEQLLGVDIIIDDTPEALTVSCFNPIRREIAVRTINILIKDGRIQPGKIEEVANKCKAEIEESIRKAGQEAVFKLGLGNMNKELVYYVGRLKYRTSYGQNQLEHSIETARLCGAMAAELGLDQVQAKRAGLLHDIGKSVDYEVEGSHVEIGARLAKKYGESDIVINAIESHHGDVKAKYVISHLVAAADTLSAARPGARSETLETYIKRIEQLEEICKSFDGVMQCYAMQSGREVRVIVIPEKVDDLGAFKIAHDIKERIEKEMSYPGQIKVNVIREYRAIETAK